jgi:hypothetical protein
MRGATIAVLILMSSASASLAQSWEMEDSNHYSRGTSSLGADSYSGSNGRAESSTRWASRTLTAAGPQMGSTARTIDGRANPGFRESPAWNLDRASAPKTFGQHYGTGFTPNYFGAFGQGYGIGYGHNYFGNPGQLYGTGYGPKY